jgi:hypothetical protein
MKSMAVMLFVVLSASSFSALAYEASKYAYHESGYSGKVFADTCKPKSADDTNCDTRK